ncbi:CoA transferase [Nocardia miyunensis]|uniref:CoA transferase n=1 Tax=Nocardia miyunensis TaxID=282684 RepID=UPI00082F2798|nr:CoA transferase [Nocardia miyunensis]
MSGRRSEGPLAGVRVIDATSGIAGPIASMILGDFGAQVIRLQDGLNDAGADLPGSVMWHRNKTITSMGRGPALVAGADVVVTSGAQAAAALGVPVDGPEPTGLVHLHVPGWGAGKDLDPLTADRFMQAEYGIARRQTSFGGGPVDCVYPFATYLQGTWAAASAIAALVGRETAGVGQRVVVDPLHGAIVAATTTMFADPLVSLPTTSVGPGGPNPAFGTYQCGDGEWLFLGALGVKFQDIAFELLGTTDITEHPRIAANREQIYAVDLRDQVRARIAEGFRAKDRDAWLAEFAEAGCPASAVGDRDTWLDHPQIIALGQRIEIDDPQVGRVVMGGNPVRFSQLPEPDYQARTYSDTVEWEDDRHERHARRAPQDAGALPGRGPLHGIRVLDLGTVLAGPYAGQLLAGLGADVVKVETTGGDEFRVRGYMINRGQRGLSIDLRDPRGYAAFGELAGTCNVVLDNFRPGVVERLRIDLENLRAFRPDIVTTSITGYGGIGPLGRQPGYDPVIQALSGIMRGQGGAAEPVFCTVSVNDVGVATLAALGTCAALYQQISGRGGQAVATSLAATSAYMQNGELVRFAGRRPAESGGRDYPGPSAISRYYECADGWVRVHLPSAETALKAGLADAAALHSDDSLAAALTVACKELPSQQIAALVEPHGGTVARGRDNKELLFDEVTLADGHIGVVTWPDGNRSYMPRQYAAFGRHADNPMMTTPGMGEHSRQILIEAGIDSSKVDELIEAGVVVQGEPLHSVAGTGYR